MEDPTSSSQFTSIQDEQTPRQLPPVATQLNPSHSQAAKATSHVDQTLPSSSQTCRDEQLSQLSTTPPSNGTTHPSLPPLSIPPPPSSSSSSSKSPSSLLPKLKTHPADLVSPSHPDGQHSSNVHSPNGSIPFTPIRNSYEDLPSATQADDGQHGDGFGSSFIEDGERDEAGEEREERRLEREERDRRQSVGEGSENGATVGSHEVRGGCDEAENEMEKINGLEVVGEEALVNSSTPPMKVVQLNNDQERHSRSMSTPPPRLVQPLPSQAPSVFSPSSPPAMSPPSNPLPPIASSNPPSRRPSTNNQSHSQSRPSTTTSTTDPTSTSNSNKVSPPTQTRSRKEDEQPPPTSSRSRRVLGEYQMTKTLGAGSMGKVKLGVSGISGEKVAIKIIPRFTSTAAAHRPEPSSTSSSSAAKKESTSVEPLPPTASFLAKAAAKDQSKEVRTVREGSLCLLLHHPYVCGMREMMIYPHHYYFVQEYVNGGQMLDYIISHGRLRERSARKFARQIGSALEYCHANSIVHRDLKIENILISKTGNIKIIDFGLSNLYSPLSHLSTFCGSLYFAAPELLNAKPYTGPEVDVWSFGIVLYVLVCGKVPFDDQSMPALHAKIKRGQVEYPSWLSAECKHLLSRMLVTVPAQRASLQEVLSHPWVVKGFTGPPAAHIPSRTPLRFGELDQEVLKGMTGFEFGTKEAIEENLEQVLNSELYRAAVKSWEIKRSKEVGKEGMSSRGRGSFSEEEKDRERPSMRIDGKDIKRSPTNKRFSGLGFYGKKLAGGFNAAFAGTNAPSKLGDGDGLGGGGGGEGNGVSPGFFGAGGMAGGSPRPDQLDPTRGFHPLLSIYYLVKEKIERERIWGPGVFASSTISLTGPPPPPAPQQAYQAGSTITSPALQQQITSPELARPPIASPQVPMTPQPRQRATGEEPFAPHPSTAPQLPRTSISASHARPSSTLPSTSSAPNSPAIPSFRPQPTSYEPPTSPSPRERTKASTSSSTSNRMSLMLSPSERERLSESTTTSNSNGQPQPQSSEDVPLSSSTSSGGSGGFARRFGSLLGRSSPESGKGHRSRASVGGMSGHRASTKTPVSPLPQVSESTSGTTPSNLRPPPITRLPSSGSDVPLASPPNGKPVTRASTVGEISPGRHQRGVSMGATTSLMRGSNEINGGTTTTTGESSSVGRSGTGFFERRRQASSTSSTSGQPPPLLNPTSRPGTSNDIAGMFDNVEEEELADSAVVVPAPSSSTSTSTRPIEGGGGSIGSNQHEVGFIGRTPSRSSSGKDASESSAKPVWLKGLFSVSTTTTKPVATLRGDLIKVLDRLGVQHRDVKNGFECAHVPSIDLSSFGGGGGGGKDKKEKTTIKRRASKLLLSKNSQGEVNQSQDDGTTTTGLDDSQSSLRIVTDPPQSSATRARTQSSSSFTTPVSPISQTGNSPPQTGGARFEGTPSSNEGTSTAAVSNDMIVRFEIFIVKMPLLPGFHGIQFRRISGNAYLTLVKRILQELKL